MFLWGEAHGICYGGSKTDRWTCQVHDEIYYRQALLGRASSIGNLTLSFPLFGKGVCLSVCLSVFR